MRKVLLVGGNGFIGSYIQDFITKSYSDRLEYIVYDGDILKIHSTKEWTDYFDANGITDIICLAWKMGKDYLDSDENYDYIDACYLLAKAFSSYKPDIDGTIVFTGSCLESEKDDPYQIELSQSLNGMHHAYSNAKNILRTKIRDLFDGNTTNNYKVCYWLRLFYVFGYGEPQDKFITNIIRNGYKKNYTMFLNDADSRLDYVPVEKVAVFCIEALFKEYDNGFLQANRYFIYNVCSGIATKRRDIIEYISNKLGRVYWQNAQTNTYPKYMCGSAIKSEEYFSNVNEIAGVTESIYPMIDKMIEKYKSDFSDNFDRFDVKRAEGPAIFKNVQD